jgi:hypothetical protein
MIVKKNGDIVASGKIIDGDGNVLGETSENSSNSGSVVSSLTPIIFLDEELYKDGTQLITIRIRDAIVDEDTFAGGWYGYTDYVRALSGRYGHFEETFVHRNDDFASAVIEEEITISFDYGNGEVYNYNVTGDSSAVSFINPKAPLCINGTGKILTETSDKFSVTTAWDGSTSTYVPAIKIGNTILTETKLNKIIAFVDGIESGDPAVVEPIAQDYLDNTVAEEGTW